MQLALKEYESILDDVDERVIETFLTSLPDRYFASFLFEQQCDHIRSMAGFLASDRHFELLFNRRGKSVSVTVFSYDSSALFMVIVGALSGMGFDIESGQVYTYLPKKSPVKRRVSRRMLRQPKVPIIDHFVGTIDSPLSYLVWCRKIRVLFKRLFLLLDDESGRQRAVEEVNRLVADRMASMDVVRERVLYPMDLSLKQRDDGVATLRLVSEDTPFFLFAVASAMVLHEVSIEGVSIETDGHRVSDTFYLLDAQKRPIQKSIELDRLKLSIMLTKQFTYFLYQSSNPYEALSRFKHVVDYVLSLSKQDEWLDLLSRSDVLLDIAKILGGSDFIWEDFIRLQYESLLPILTKKMNDTSQFKSIRGLSKRFRTALHGVSDFSAFQAEINRLKDQELYYIDLNQMMGNVSFREFSSQLTALAELVLRVACKRIYRQLVALYGRPMSVSGTVASYALCGLGKLGGAALGYASDIEIMLIYSDAGQTDGNKSISNADFFDRFVQLLRQTIVSKQDGIFQLDFRLRPHGQDGPLSVSVARFCGYYGSSEAHFYERLALVRLRFVAGDRRLGRRLLALRDEYVYQARDMDVNDLWDLRKKQMNLKSDMSQFNAKFSPGALVDLEYAVQALQVGYGSQFKVLRTAKLHVALDALSQLGILPEAQEKSLQAAYDFFRKLINGLRMLRGSAKDLQLPDPRSIEYDHLARRVGYERQSGLDEARHLYLDVSVYSAQIRHFVKTFFSGGSLANPLAGNMADLVLMKDVSKALYESILSRLSFRSPETAYANICRISNRVSETTILAQVMVLAGEIFSGQSDPDRTLNHWERFTEKIDDVDGHLSLLLSQPIRLQLLLDIFSVSDFLAAMLEQYPDVFVWVTEIDHLYTPLQRPRLDEELENLYEIISDSETWHDTLNRIRKREILRIALRDVTVEVSFNEVTAELSRLAQVIVEWMFRWVFREVASERAVPAKICKHLADHFSILALGKLGGGELNYSSDLDLLCVYDEDVLDYVDKDERTIVGIYTAVVERLSQALMRSTDREGGIYRIDFRLRPYGESGGLVVSQSAMLHYVAESARLWEKQALLKLSPVAGNWAVGFSLKTLVAPWLACLDLDAVLKSIRRLREESVKASLRRRLGGIDLKNGEGGIRDIEFLTQFLQLKWLEKAPSLNMGHTLFALIRLRNKGCLAAEIADELMEHYVFLRRIEHILQLMDDRQTHSLPSDEMQLDILARKVMGEADSVPAFLARVSGVLGAVRQQYDGILAV